MKHQYLFLLGRPGCGKSAFYRELKRQLFKSGQSATIERVDDFPKLWAKFLADDDLESEGKERIYTKRIAEGHYKFTDDAVGDAVLDLALQELSSDVLRSHGPNHMVVVEFSRSNYIPAMQLFDPCILDNCMVIYLEVGFDICWARNVARHEASIAAGGDDHLVPRHDMEVRYLHDDKEALVQYMKARDIPVAVINNEAEGKEHLRRQVAELFEDLF